MKKIIDFSRFSSIKAGAMTEVEIIDSMSWNKEGYFIVGAASNLLVTSNTKKLARLSKEFDYIKIEGDTLVIGGATSSGKILSFAKKHNIANFEFLSKIPGLLGGMVKMNAGLKEWEIFNHLISIKTSSGVFNKSEIVHSYRHTQIEAVIFEAVFELSFGYSNELYEKFLQMRQNQPKLPSAGSCFKNPLPHFAGKLIEDVGLKGAKIGNMGFSDEHANFLVNHGNGTAQEALELIDLAKKLVLDKFGVFLEEEIIII